MAISAPFSLRSALALTVLVAVIVGVCAAPLLASGQQRSQRGGGVCCLATGCDTTLNPKQCAESGGEFRPDLICDQLMCNDVCAVALIIDGDLLSGIDAAFTNTQSRLDGIGEDARSCMDWPSGGEAAAWFELTPPCDGLLDIITSGDDTELSVWRHCPNPGDGHLIIGCASDEGINFEAELVDFTVDAAESYFVRITHWGDEIDSEIGVQFLLHDCAEPCVGDVNSDGLVNVADLLAVINNWGGDGSSGGDANDDGAVNVSDLLAVINHWGAAC